MDKEKSNQIVQNIKDDEIKMEARKKIEKAKKNCHQEKSKEEYNLEQI